MANDQRECSCGKKGTEMDSCYTCTQSRRENMLQSDSIILESLKTALVFTFFQQTYYHDHNSGSSRYIGGEAARLVEDILKSQKWKDLVASVTASIAEDRVKWHDLGIEEFKKVLVQNAAQYAKNWDITDKFNTAAVQVGREYALEMMKNDPVLKEKINRAVDGGDYTVDISVSVRVVKKQIEDTTSPDQL